MLGRSVLVAGDLATGQLVEPFELRVPASYAYYWVTSDTRAQDSVLSDFKSFIAEITKGDADLGHRSSKKATKQT